MEEVPDRPADGEFLLQSKLGEGWVGRPPWSAAVSDVVAAFFQVQFVLVMVHAFQLFFTDCDYPKAFCWWIGMHAVMFYFLFSDFYKQNYLKKEARRKVSFFNAVWRRVKNNIVFTLNGPVHEWRRSFGLRDDPLTCSRAGPDQARAQLNITPHGRTLWLWVH